MNYTVTVNVKPTTNGREIDVEIDSLGEASIHITRNCMAGTVDQTALELITEGFAWIFKVRANQEQT